MFSTKSALVGPLGSCLGPWALHPPDMAEALWLPCCQCCTSSLALQPCLPCGWFSTQQAVTPPSSPQQTPTWPQQRTQVQTAGKATLVPFPEAQACLQAGPVSVPGHLNKWGQRRECLELQVLLLRWSLN